MTNIDASREADGLEEKRMRLNFHHSRELINIPV
jgi:hypothetical protein